MASRCPGKNHKRQIMEIKNHNTWLGCMANMHNTRKKKVRAKLIHAAHRLKRKLNILQRTCEFVLPEMDLSVDEHDALNQIRQRCMEVRQQLKVLLTEIEAGSQAIMTTLTRVVVPEIEGLEDVLKELTGERWNFAIDELIDLIDIATRNYNQDRNAQRILFYLHCEKNRTA